MGEWERKGFELQRVHRHLHVKKTLADVSSRLKNQERSFFGGGGTETEGEFSTSESGLSFFHRTWSQNSHETIFQF